MYLLQVLGIVATASAISAEVQSGSCRSRLGVLCSCPPDWQLRARGNECYRLTQFPFAWDDAKMACRVMGGKMAAPRSLEEMSFMAELARHENANYRAWIACNDRGVDGAWECDGQEELSQPFLAWARGKPNNFGGYQDCVRMAALHDDRMDDESCDVSFLAFCVRQAACAQSLTRLSR